MRLGAPVRGVIYGIGALSVPLAWMGGYGIPAVGIIMLVLVGMVAETITRRRP